MENLNLFLDIPFDIVSFHLFHRISIPLHFCEVIEICPSAAGSIYSIILILQHSEDTSMSLLY